MYPDQPPVTSLYHLGGEEESAPAAPEHPDAAHTGIGQHHHLFSVKNVLWLLFFLGLTLATRCANYRNVFIPGDRQFSEVYFVDGDCYSRMTRVREVLAHGGIIHYHAWENYPTGTWPHTTAPMDYLIAGIALLLKPFFVNYIDLAGAIVSPLLGVMTTAFLAYWAVELNQRYRRLMLLLVSLSPILVHGTALGRPDHQSLQIFLAAVGLGAELAVARTPRRSWYIISGLAWGLALWVSLYEPLVLLLIIFLTKLVFHRERLFVKERFWTAGFLLSILAVGYALEGWNYKEPDAAFLHYFRTWSSTIGEMAPVPILSPLLTEWVGWGLLVAPLLLIARLRDTRRSVLLLALLVTTFAFTLTQVRWGYFFALVYAMSLPWQLSLFRKPWIVYSLFFLSLWPVARDWEQRLYPDEEHDFVRVARVNDQRRLRQVAYFIKDHNPGGILAPWWWSPQLVYWSGQPAMAGSSHESLAGIVDTARFFAATDIPTARAICYQHKVETVVIGQPGIIVDQSLRILHQPVTDHTLGEDLWEKPSSAPPFLRVLRDNSVDNNVIKVFHVIHPLYAP